MTEVLRAAIFHTRHNPFADERALVALADGGLAIEEGRIALCDDYSTVVAAYPGSPVRDLRGGCILPGFIDGTPTIRRYGFWAAWDIRYSTGSRS